MYLEMVFNEKNFFRDLEQSASIILIVLFLPNVY